MKKSSPLTTAYNMWVHYNGTCVHYALIIPYNSSWQQCCRLKLAEAFGWENPEGRSTWEFILPNILDKEVKVHLMQAMSGAKFSSKGMFYSYEKDSTRNREEFLEYISEDNSPEQVKLIRLHLDRYAAYLGGYEREERYDSEKWKKQLTKVTGD
mgnify:CR=1 FL=1